MHGHIVLIAAVLASLLCSGASGSPKFHPSESGTGAQPEKCCLPKQWSSNMLLLGSVNAGEMNVLDVQMDYDKQQQAMLNYTGSSKTPVTKIVINYAKKMLYVVPTNYPDYCYKAPLDIPMIRCIPDDAEFLGDSYLGPMGAGQLSYNAWRIRAPVGNSSVVYTLATSKTGCVPLVEGVAHPDNPSQNQLFMISKYQTGLSDPSVFNLPASCNK